MFLGGLPPTLRPGAAAAGLPGRGEQATDRRNGAAPASRAGSSGSGSITSMSATARPTSVRGSPNPSPRVGGMSKSPSDGRPRTFAEVLRLAGRGSAPRRRQGRVGDGQPQHPQIGIAVRGVPAPTRHAASLRGWKFISTPKHGSWLNVAEIGSSVLARTVSGPKRIAAAETLVCEVGAWEEARNEQAIGVHWRFTTADARIKLRRLYPSPL